MIGYKVFTATWTAVCGKGGTTHPYQYQVGQSYEQSELPEARRTGFHFCADLINCFNYYHVDQMKRIAMVEAYGTIDQDGDAYCTDKMKILKEIPWREVMDIIEAQMKEDELDEM